MGKGTGTCGSRLPTSSGTGAHHGHLARLDDACRARPMGRRVAPARRVSYRAIETGGGHPFQAKYLFAFELIRILLAMAILNSPAHASLRLGGGGRAVLGRPPTRAFPSARACLPCQPSLAPRKTPAHTHLPLFLIPCCGVRLPEHDIGSLSVRSLHLVILGPIRLRP